MARTTYMAGDFKRVCDRCGTHQYASDTTQEWSGRVVCTAGCKDVRNPQDFVVARADSQGVHDPRPDGGIFLATNDVTASNLSVTGTAGSVPVSSPDYLATNEVTAADL